MKFTKQIISIFLVAIILCTSVSVVASAADWRTGNFGGGYTTVRLSNCEKSGKIRIHTYKCNKFNLNHTGKCRWSGETSAKIHIKLCNGSGKWLCEWDTTSKATLKLGKDNTEYRVYITRQNLNNPVDQMNNIGKSAHWAIETVSNTKF